MAVCAHVIVNAAVTHSPSRPPTVLMGARIGGAGVERGWPCMLRVVRAGRSDGTGSMLGGAIRYLQVQTVGAAAAVAGLGCGPAGHGWPDEAGRARLLVVVAPRRCLLWPRWWRRVWPIILGSGTAYEGSVVRIVRTTGGFFTATHR